MYAQTWPMQPVPVPEVALWWQELRSGEVWFTEPDDPEVAVARPPAALYLRLRPEVITSPKKLVAFTRKHGPLVGPDAAKVPSVSIAGTDGREYVDSSRLFGTVPTPLSDLTIELPASPYPKVPFGVVQLYATLIANAAAIWRTAAIERKYDPAKVEWVIPDDYGEKWIDDRLVTPPATPALARAFVMDVVNHALRPLSYELFWHNGDDKPKHRPVANLYTALAAELANDMTRDARWQPCKAGDRCLSGGWSPERRAGRQYCNELCKAAYHQHKKRQSAKKAKGGGLK